jgi:hypothetical protein
MQLTTNAYQSSFFWLTNSVDTCRFPVPICGIIIYNSSSLTNQNSLHTILCLHSCFLLVEFVAPGTFLARLALGFIGCQLVSQFLYFYDNRIVSQC